MGSSRSRVMVAQSAEFEQAYYAKQRIPAMVVGFN